MKAIQFYGKNDYALTDVARPEIKDGEILLKVKAAAVCGSDLRMIQNGYQGVTRKHPVSMGMRYPGSSNRQENP